jgi:dienelactone hydrolase
MIPAILIPSFCLNQLFFGIQLKRSLHLSLILCSFFVITVQGQRFKTDIFTSMDSNVNIRYGEAKNIKNEMETLMLDIFMPSADTMKKRPLIVFIHGGGFQNGNRKVSITQRTVRQFVPKGYVVSCISYRLGIEDPKSNKDYAEAMYRAQQDARTAIRFLKANATRWNIDTAQVFVCGTSAGAMTSLALAYMDEQEVPKEVNINKWGPLEGNNENNAYSSKVKAVMNLWGSMIDYRWINQGDVPLYNTAGTEDKTVPYDSSFSYHNFKYGPYILYQHCLATGIPTSWRAFYGVGHTLDSKKPMLDSCFSEMSDWLFTQLKSNSPLNRRSIKRNKIRNHRITAIGSPANTPIMPLLPVFAKLQEKSPLIYPKSRFTQIFS